MKDTRSLVRSVLDKGYLMSLATTGEAGVWVSDVIYVHDNNFNIYWLSLTSTRHSEAIAKNNKVAGTITLTDKPGSPDIGLQFEGIAEKIEGDILEMAIRHRLKRGKPAPKREGEILDPGESWYRLRPTKIELIYEPLFGFKKQVLKI